MMIDANAIADLQMMMNTGDARHAVLTELLQTSTEPDDAPANTIGAQSKKPSLAGRDRPFDTRLEIRGPRNRRMRLYSSGSYVNRRRFTLTDNILQTLNRLSNEDKEPLVTFAEGLAHHYNNLFMAVIGHISIILLHLKPTDPAFDKLRRCEELIHSTALLIRLLLDVFHRNGLENKTAYPIDLSQQEIKKRIFPNANESIGGLAEDGVKGELDAYGVLEIISATMERRLNLILNELFMKVNNTMALLDVKSKHRHHFQRIKTYIRRGIKITKSL